MAAKLVIFGLLLLIVVVAFLVMLYRYLENAAQRKHEEKIRKMKQTDKIMEQHSIDSQLERERDE